MDNIYEFFLLNKSSFLPKYLQNPRPLSSCPLHPSSLPPLPLVPAPSTPASRPPLSPYPGPAVNPLSQTHDVAAVFHLHRSTEN